MVIDNKDIWIVASKGRMEGFLNLSPLGVLQLDIHSLGITMRGHVSDIEIRAPHLPDMVPTMEVTCKTDERTFWKVCIEKDEAIKLQQSIDSLAD